MHRSTSLIGTAALGLLLGALACQDDTLLRPSTLTPVDPMFARYVSMGNSITAGFQSGGINDSTQVLAYGNLLARQMRTPYFQPLLNRPGCPPPIVNVFLRTVVGPPLNPALPCALRKQQPVPPPFLNDVAVPGAGVEDILSNLSPGANTLTTIILGGMSQTGAMLRANPTFVSVWIGNNDVLGPATDTANAGNPAELLDPTAFAASYDSILDAIGTTPASGKGILLGVNDVTTIPYFSYGSVYLGAKLAGALPANFTVSPDCAPQSLGGVGDTTLVPFRYGFGLIAASAAGPVTLDCLNDHNITPSELANLHAIVVAYNTHVAAQATSKGYAFIDPNPLILALKADTAQFAVFPHANPADPKFTTAPFGSAFSRDGVHPSTASHKLIANTLIQTINAKYGTKLPAIP
jgi:GDSL-like lipase/acylhydrolase family protein